MTSENMLDFYTQLGFEEIEIADSPPAFFWETEADGDYILVTDTEGAIPSTVKQPIIVAFYDASDRFQWSTSFKNSYLFRDIWDAATTANDKLRSLQEYRKQNEL